MVRQRLVLQPSQLEHLGQEFELTPSQYNYLVRVLRLQGGDEFIALDGKGKRWRSLLTEKLTTAQIMEPISSPNSELDVDLILAVAMPKGNGMENVIRQATELGVSSIQPLWSDRTVIRPHSSLGEAKLARWSKIAAEIAEQSHRSYVPIILAPVTFDQALAQYADVANRYICVTVPRTKHLLQVLTPQPPGAAIILTGPEGGWTAPETHRAIAAGYEPVGLGNRILAAVTAPVVALSIITATLEAPQC